MPLTFTPWNVDATQILTRAELAAVLASLRRRARRLPNVKMNLALVRLACCCGLRARRDRRPLDLGAAKPCALLFHGRPRPIVPADFQLLKPIRSIARQIISQTKRSE